MDLEHFARGALSACRSQFPRTCRCCGTSFKSFDHYLEKTTLIGKPMLDPIEDDDEPIGMLCFANCACGSTLALCYEDTSEHAAFNRALADAARSTGRTHVDVGLDIVEQVNRWAREAPTKPPASTSSSSSLSSQAPVADPLVLEFGAALLQTIEAGQISIPPAPTAALKVRSLVASDDVNIRAVADALAIDPGLATGVLRVANSAHFNRGGEVSSLVQAVTRLGFKEVAQLSLTLGVGRAFMGGGPFAQHRAHLWRKSLVTAILAKTLARSRRLDGEDCFVGGLFSSLGAVVGLLSLEEILKTRTDLPAQQWGWWLRLVDLFAADLGREAAARWQLPSLIASVAAHPHPHPGERPAQHGEVVTMVALTRAVAERVLERPRVERADLEDIVGLTADERAQLVNAIPSLAQAIAAFDAGLPRLTTPPTSSTGAPPEPVPPPATPLMASTVVPDAVRCDIVGLVSDALVLQGPQSFPVTTLVAVELELEPRLRLWGVVTHAWSAATGQCTRLAPFAVDDAAWNRWRLLVTEHAAARTQATLRQMEVAKRPR
jgi:HD-like signal output (HDOD) protein